MRRREVLAGALAAPAALALGTGLFTGPARQVGLVLYNRAVPRAGMAAQRAALLGIATLDTGGEIAGLLLRQRHFASSGAALGLTGHAEMLLAADMARSAGRKLIPLAQLGRQDRWFGGTEAELWRPLALPLLAPAAAGPHQTAFAWIVPGPARS